MSTSDIRRGVWLAISLGTLTFIACPAVLMMVSDATKTPGSEVREPSRRVLDNHSVAVAKSMPTTTSPGNIFLCELYAQRQKCARIVKQIDENTRVECVGENDQEAMEIANEAVKGWVRRNERQDTARYRMRFYTQHPSYFRAISSRPNPLGEGTIVLAAKDFREAKPDVLNDENFYRRRLLVLVLGGVAYLYDDGRERTLRGAEEWPDDVQERSGLGSYWRATNGFHLDSDILWKRFAMKESSFIEVPPKLQKFGGKAEQHQDGHNWPFADCGENITDHLQTRYKDRVD